MESEKKQRIGVILLLPALLAVVFVCGYALWIIVEYVIINLLREYPLATIIGIVFIVCTAFGFYLIHEDE